VIYAIDLEIEIARYGKKRNEIFEFFLQQGVYLRPLGNTIYIVPPYVITAAELAKVYQSIKNFLNEFHH
jgi:adenosylmethionine-8-amino-7-oxononanoate aminotransferase